MRSKIWALLAGSPGGGRAAVCAPLLHGYLRRDEDGEDRGRARAVHVPQPACVRARDGAGRERQMQRWGVEWGGAGALAGQGVTRDSLKPGDKVVITGNPGRNAIDHRVRMRTLLRPSDGFGWGQNGETFD